MATDNLASHCTSENHSKNQMSYVQEMVKAYEHACTEVTLWWEVILNACPMPIRHQQKCPINLMMYGIVSFNTMLSIDNIFSEMTWYLLHAVSSSFTLLPISF